MTGFVVDPTNILVQFSQQCLVSGVGARKEDRQQVGVGVGVAQPSG